MLCCLAGLARKVDEVITRTVRRVACAARRLWRGHVDRAATNAAYAAAAAAVIGGLLGFVPARDVIAAILTAVFGIYINGARPAGGLARAVDPWDLD
ncbi:MAG TPA: hypothetical protein VGH43_18765 [Jatrophihabitans sp.]|jgi:hypothetical protein